MMITTLNHRFLYGIFDINIIYGAGRFVNSFLKFFSNDTASPSKIIVALLDSKHDSPSNQNKKAL